MTRLAEKSGRALAVTAFKAVEDALRSQIAEGRWPVGQMIPSRRALAQEFGVNLETLQRGVEGLIADGTLRSDSRRGTYVARSSSGTPIVSHRPYAQATVGIIGPIRRLETGEWSDIWNNIVVGAIEQTVTKRNGRTRFSNTYIAEGPDGEPLWHEAESLVPGLLAEGVDCIVFVQPRSFSRNLLAFAENLPTKTIVVGAMPLRNNLSCVYYDSIDAGFQAAQHVATAGWDNITFFAPFVSEWVEQRCQGARECAEQRGVEFEAIIDTGLKTTDGWFEQRTKSRDTARRKVAEGWRPASVIAANDDVAAGVIDALVDVGLAPGKDYGLVGFDDKHISRELNITSFRPPLAELGREAARLALSVSDRTEPAMKISLHSHLIARRSSQRIA